MKDVSTGQSQMGYHAYEGQELMRQWVAIKAASRHYKKLKGLAKINTIVAIFCYIFSLICIQVQVNFYIIPT
ncbi:UDP-3-O-[3-hydroxymyristoyl] glucosamine N-acyltransferase [Francisella sp. W12-1067]|nr:UDP-3-O-[3-hydroxymyristoyl] glucosamine N-acyltransferase [Francisella sp. W12-1067]